MPVTTGTWTDRDKVKVQLPLVVLWYGASDHSDCACGEPQAVFVSEADADAYLVRDSRGGATIHGSSTSILTLYGALPATAPPEAAAPTDAAIEAAARAAQHAYSERVDRLEWAELGDAVRDTWRAAARAAIDAYREAPW